MIYSFGGQDSYPIEPSQQRFAYTGTNLTYQGWARTGALASDPDWTIKKYTYDVDDNLIQVTWSIGQSNKWDDRASLTYA